MLINKTDYVTGMFRGDGGDRMVTHLYKGSFDDPGFPMCARGWQRKFYNKRGKLVDYEYSIFRNNLSSAGLCKICERRANKNLPPIEKPSLFK